MDENLLRELYVNRNMTIQQVTDYLQSQHPGERGFSYRNVVLHLRMFGLRRPYVPDDVLRRYVEESVAFLGANTGRRILEGHLRGHYGVSVSTRRLARILADVSPVYVAARRIRVQLQVNPRPYRVPYFGINCHADQNEKLGMCGCVYVMIVDGLSLMIVAASVMYVKNPIIILDEVFNPMLRTLGLWRKLHLDGGTEFNLIEYYQKKLHLETGYALDQREAENTVRRTTSVQNNRIERVWKPLNDIVSYGFKNALVHAENLGLFDMGLEHHKYSVSQVLIRLCHRRLDKFVEMWNYHRIPDTGRPISYVERSQAFEVDQRFILPARDVAATYPGVLTEPYSFGRDLLADRRDLQILRDNYIFGPFVHQLAARFVASLNNVQARRYRTPLMNDPYHVIGGAASNFWEWPVTFFVLGHIKFSEYLTRYI